ncbi:hypothetical protein CFIO01_08710 [Colletotrichum fioriniae PJ7]|uniref:BTB domain-containing protein n=1 Tax=Colletotrichum fioriniae PJ7 TaxID=1445577 RepID=A0A010RXJ9_9PEZI|nr:hypothetical protein CFIO01_08710 [Colletotrichum fioriniae PJ7]
MADYQPPSIFPKNENSIFSFSAEKSLLPKPILPVRSPRPKSPKKRVPEPIILDERGDLYLHVGNPPTPLRVCSRSLARVCPVFAKMLFGGWKESCPQIANGPKEGIKSEASKEAVSKDEVSEGKAGEGEGPASKDEADEGKTGEVEVSKDEAGEDESSKDKASEGESAESKRAKDWIIELPEDGLEETILLFEIIHGHFDRVPFSLSVRRLHDLLVLCNKYDVLSLLRPWAWHWLSTMRSNLDEPYVLWVAWEMGDVLLFRDMVVRIAEGVPISALNNNAMGVQYGKQRMHWTPQNGQINEFPMIPLDCLQNTTEDDLSGNILDSFYLRETCLA